MTETVLTGENVVPPALDFNKLVSHVKETFAKNSDKIIFCTRQIGAAAEVSFNKVYLEMFSDALRAEHNCFTCRSFLKNYAGLVYVNTDGDLQSAVWDENGVDAEYIPVVKALREKAEAGHISHRFFSDEEVLGAEHKGEHDGTPWQHFHVITPERAKVPVTETVPGMVAKYALNRRLFSESFGSLKVETIKDAIHVFTYDPEMSRRSGRVEILEQYLKARDIVSAATGQRQANLKWYWSSRLPGEAASLVNTALGQYLELVTSSPSLARNRYLEATSGDNYMRPVKEATEGAINAAEKLIEQLGLKESLQRRAAVLSDIPEDKWVWRHPEAVEAEKESGGVFDKLRKQVAENPKTPIQGPNKDWAEFVKEILPVAKSVMVQVPQRSNYGRMLTAVNPDAPPLLIWDSLEYRNPMSHYVYVERDVFGHPKVGSSAEKWGLKGADYVRLVGVVPVPHCWNPELQPQSFAYGEMLVLEGASEVASNGLGLFPEIVTRDLYPVRQVIENFSNQSELPRSEEGEFAGIILSKGFDAGGPVAKLVVELESGVVVFNITRWN